MSDKDAAIDTAWQIHSTLAAWTANVDSKASFASAIETGMLAGVIALAGDNHRLSNLETGWTSWFFWLGIGTLVASLLAVLYVVRPRLRSRVVKEEASQNFVFFGHLRKWTADDLQEALLEKDILPVLSRQLVAMSRIAWVKHRALQLSITGTVAAGLLLSAAAYLNG